MWKAIMANVRLSNTSQHRLPIMHHLQKKNGHNVCIMVTSMKFDFFKVLTKSCLPNFISEDHLAPVQLNLATILK
jgi:hypothetical protein